MYIVITKLKSLFTSIIGYSYWSPFALFSEKKLFPSLSKFYIPPDILQDFSILCLASLSCQAADCNILCETLSTPEPKNILTQPKKYLNTAQKIFHLCWQERHGGKHWEHMEWPHHVDAITRSGPLTTWAEWNHCTIVSREGAGIFGIQRITNLRIYRELLLWLITPFTDPCKDNDHDHPSSILIKALFVCLSVCVTKFLHEHVPNCKYTVLVESIHLWVTS